MEWGIPVQWAWFLLFSRSGGHKTNETYLTPCKQGLSHNCHFMQYFILFKMRSIITLKTKATVSWYSAVQYRCHQIYCIALCTMLGLFQTSCCCRYIYRFDCTQVFIQLPKIGFLLLGSFGYNDTQNECFFSSIQQFRYLPESLLEWKNCVFVHCFAGVFNYFGCHLVVLPSIFKNQFN